MKNLWILIFVITLISCKNHNVKAEYIEIKDNIARFDIINKSNKDIEKITFEIRFLDNLDKILLTDTIEYLMSKEYFKDKTPFLKANDKTFIVQSIPNNCKKADIKILEVDNIDEN